MLKDFRPGPLVALIVPAPPLWYRIAQAAAACLILLAGAAAQAHFSVDSVDRYFVVGERDGRLVAQARVPLPFLLAAELDAAARDGVAVDAPVLARNGPDMVLRPDLVAANAAYFTALLATAHEWRVGARRVDPTVLRWRIALMSQEAALPFGSQARKILSLPSLPGPAPLGQALVDFELDLGPAEGDEVSVRFALPPLVLPAGIAVSNNLTDAVASPPVARIVPGQMTAPEVIVLPPPGQIRAGVQAGLWQVAAGLAGAALGAALLAGLLRPGAAGWMFLGFAAGLWGAPMVETGAGLRPFLPLAAVALVACWAALTVRRRGGTERGRALALLLGVPIGLATGIEGLAALDGSALRPLLRWGFAGGCLAALAGAALFGLGLRRLAARAALPVAATFTATFTAAALLAMLALAGMQTAQAVSARAAGAIDPLLRLPVEAAADQGFDFISAALAELHRAVQTGPDAVAALVAGDPAEVLGTAAARLAETGLPPTEPDLHEVALSAFQMRRSGRTLSVSAAWQVLGLKAKGGHEHVKGADFAADFVLRRSWGRWRIEAFTLKQ